MASSNFLQWNPGEANQESDAQYGADVLRSGGLPQGSIVPGPTLNKVLYQASALAAALGIMFANKGYSLNDGDVNVLAAVLAHIRLDGDMTPPFQALGYAPNLQVNLGAAETTQIFLGGNVSLSFTGATPGAKRQLVFVQDGTGNHQVAYPTGSGANQILGWSQPAGDANSVSVQEYFVDGNGTLRAITSSSVT